MYKAENTDSGEIFKSHNIYEIIDAVQKKPSENYQFYIGYKPYKKTEFLKKILQETRNYSVHSRLDAAINNSITIIEYANRKIQNT